MAAGTDRSLKALRTAPDPIRPVDVLESGHSRLHSLARCAFKPYAVVPVPALSNGRKVRAQAKAARFKLCAQVYDLSTFARS